MRSATYGRSWAGDAYDQRLRQGLESDPNYPLEAFREPGHRGTQARNRSALSFRKVPIAVTRPSHSSSPVTSEPAIIPRLAM